MNENVSKRLESIENKTTNYSVSKYNLYKISSLKKIVEKSYLYKDECEVCSQNLNSFNEYIELLDQIDSDLEARNRYSRWFLSVRQHFLKKHSFYAPNYYTSIFALVVAIFLSAIAGLVTIIVIKKISLDIVLMGAAVGLILGYILGGAKDRKLIKEGKII